MKDIYDVIDELREKKGLSRRKLALMAGINPATFASMMMRRPDNISVTYLMPIADVLGVNLYDLMGMSDTHRIHIKSDAPLSSSLAEDQGHRSNNSSSAEEEPNYGVEATGRGSAPRELMYELGTRAYDNACRQNYKRSILLMLEQLNNDGLKEAMRLIAEMTASPQFERSDVPSGKDF